MNDADDEIERLLRGCRPRPARSALMAGLAAGRTRKFRLRLAMSAASAAGLAAALILALVLTGHEAPAAPSPPMSVAEESAPTSLGLARFARLGDDALELELLRLQRHLPDPPGSTLSRTRSEMP